VNINLHDDAQQNQLRSQNNNKTELLKFVSVKI